MQDLGELQFKSVKATGADHASRDRWVVVGQRMVLWSIGIFVICVVSQLAIVPQWKWDAETAVQVAMVLTAVRVVASAMGAIGILIAARGMRWGLFSRLLAAAVSLVPLLGVVVLLIANAQASAHLRGAGYQVGLIGVRKRK